MQRFVDDKLTCDERLFLAQFYDKANDAYHNVAKSYLFLGGVAEGNIQEVVLPIKYYNLD